LRAYLEVVDDNILRCLSCDVPDGDKMAEITRANIYNTMMIINIKNSGQTPAYNIHIDGDYWSGHFGEHIPKGFNYVSQKRGSIFPIENSTATLGKDEKVPGGLIIDTSVIPSIANARKHITSLFFYGNIYYDDIFEMHRDTPFCVEYIPANAEHPFVNCPEHNTPEQGK
jgi:hypothetical protein